MNTLIGKHIKDNSRRKFTGGGPRPDRTEFKRTKGAERDAKWRALSPKEQLAELDKRLGVGVGAVKQRKRIAAKMNQPKAESRRVAA